MVVLPSLRVSCLKRSEEQGKKIRVKSEMRDARRRCRRGSEPVLYQSLRLHVPVREVFIRYTKRSFENWLAKVRVALESLL